MNVLVYHTFERTEPFRRRFARDRVRSKLGAPEAPTRERSPFDGCAMVGKTRMSLVCPLSLGPSDNPVNVGSAVGEAVVRVTTRPISVTCVLVNLRTFPSFPVVGSCVGSGWSAGLYLVYLATIMKMEVRVVLASWHSIDASCSNALWIRQIDGFQFEMSADSPSEPLGDKGRLRVRASLEAFVLIKLHQSACQSAYSISGGPASWPAVAVGFSRHRSNKVVPAQQARDRPSRPQGDFAK